MANPGTDKRQKTETIRVRMTPEEAREIKNKAAAADTTLSDFVRGACLRRQITARTDRETVTQLSKIGGLLKKATKQTHERDRQKEISRVLDALQATVKELMNKQGAETVADRLAPDDTEPGGEAVSTTKPGSQRQFSRDTGEAPSKNEAPMSSRTRSQGEVEDELDLVGEG